MPTLTFPTLLRTAPTSGSFSLMPNTQTFQSPLNRTTQTVELPGARWKAAFDFNNLSEGDVRILQAFLARLRGSAGRFYLWDMTHAAPAGTAAGTPRVNGAGQTGTSILTDGWEADQAELLLPGDRIEFNGELKIVTATASSDGAGAAIIDFEPPLRSAPVDNAVITTVRPVCTMRLEDDQQDQLTLVEGRVADFRLNAVEVF